MATPNVEPLLEQMEWQEPFFLKEIVDWVVLLFGVHFVVYVIAKFLCPPTVAKKASFVAHQSASFIAQTYAVRLGVPAWLYDEGIIAMRNGTALDRMHGYHPVAHQMNCFMFGYQIYDFTSALITPEVRQAQHLGHHLLAGYTSYWSVRCRTFAPYYSIFFYGFSEISTVLLAFVDFFRQFPEYVGKSKVLSAMNEVTRVSFAVAFLALRGTYWPILIFSGFFPDLIKESAMPYPNELYYSNYFTCSLLTLLQFFWTYKVLKGLSKMISGKDSDLKERLKEA